MKVTLLAYTQLSNAIQLNAEHPLHLRHPTRYRAMQSDDWNYASDQDAIIEYAGRVCYNSIDNMYKNPDFVQKRLAQGHGDIAEHINFVFMVEDVSVACLGQMVRHGLMSHSVSSTRYVDQRNNATTIPRTISDNNLFLDKYRKVIDDCFDLYEEMRAAGIPKEDARFILPAALHTKLVVSGNALMWRNFINQRSDKAAQWEVRAVSDEILRQLYDVAPQTFVDLYTKFLQE